MKVSKGFTIIEMMVVVALIGILAVTTLIYGGRWRSDWKFSNLLHSARTAAKTARMQAMESRSDLRLIFTDADVIATTHALDTSVKFTSGDYHFSGPWTVGTEHQAYFLYNSKFYSFTPATTEFIFNSRGLPKDYQPLTVTMTSPKLKKSFTINITPLGKIE